MTHHARLLPPTSLAALAASLLLLLLSMGGCGSDIGPDGGYVGGACLGHSDCVDGARCLTGKHFPQGHCAPACDRDDACPGDAACVDREGGVCLLMCELNADCRGSYLCKGEDRAEGSGEVLVCIGD